MKGAMSRETFIFLGCFLQHFVNPHEGFPLAAFLPFELMSSRIIDRYALLSIAYLQ